jgi:hypothetical protein
MDDQSTPPTPQHVIDDIDASLRDIAEGRVHDAKDVQAEARRMLVDHERSRRTAPASAAARATRRIRSAR